jgi:Domain of unknown function (DUF4276)
MRSIALFCEDSGHEAFVGAVVRRLANRRSVKINLRVASARHGYGRVVSELGQLVRDLERGQSSLPDALIVATDANCKGLLERRKEVDAVLPDVLKPFVVHAIPDPHIERWMLLDAGAFKKVFKRGCSPPDQKCEKSRYKKILRDEVIASGFRPALGGMEFAEDIVENMDLRPGRLKDKSFGRFIQTLDGRLHSW